MGLTSFCLACLCAGAFSAVLPIDQVSREPLLGPHPVPGDRLVTCSWSAMAPLHVVCV